MNSQSRILVLEDEKWQADPFRSMLEYRGFSVRCASSVGDALAVIESFDPCTIVVDLHLVHAVDERDGFDFIRLVRQSFGMRHGILAWTSQYVNARDEIRCLRTGADAYVEKDADFGLIEARLEALMRRVRAGSTSP